MKHTSRICCLATAGLLVIAAMPASAQRSVSEGGQPAASSIRPPAASPVGSASADTRPLAIPPAAADNDYRVGPGDKLRIEVYKDQQLSQSVQIRPDGKITLPLIGDMEASGKTPLELRDTITTSLKEYMTNPVVTVIVVEAVASQVFVMGEVSKSGALQLNGPTTVLQALAMAGGFKEFANTKNVKVLRPTPSGMQTIRFNYRDAVNGDEKPLFLKAGDTIVVP